MAIQINEISEKYIHQLESNKVFNMVGINKAVSSIKQAVEETAEKAKKEIEAAIEPLEAKIASQDKFISEQTNEKRALQDKNNELEQTIVSLNSSISDKDKEISDKVKECKERIEEVKDLRAGNKSLDENNAILEQSVITLKNKLNQYKDIVKEAYKQGITHEFREQKRGIADILSSIINHKEKLQKEKEAEKLVQKEQDSINLIKPEIVEKTNKPQTAKTKTKTKINTAKITKESAYVVYKDIIKQIENERANQILDKNRIEEAINWIKALLENAPQETSRSNIKKYFEDQMNIFTGYAERIVNNRYHFEEDNYGKIRVGTDESGKVILKEHGIDFKNSFHPYLYEISRTDGSLLEIYNGSSDSYIKLYDKNKKELLEIRFSDHYSAFISDKDGRLMVAEGIEDGKIKYLNVHFNKVKPISTIEQDKPMNIYAQNLIQKAKQGCNKNEKEHRDTTDIDYINNEGKITAHEYFVNKQKNPVPIFTYIYNSENGNIEKLISTGDFGIHGKIVEDGCYKTPKIIQYRTKGVTGIYKRRPDDELDDFRISFLKSTENEHFETQSLYDKDFKDDKCVFIQRPVYEKFNYGIASHPLTKFFTFYDLSKHNIKPWDLSILKPYIK